MYAGGGTNVFSGDTFIGFATNSAGTFAISDGQLLQSNGTQ